MAKTSENKHTLTTMLKHPGENAHFLMKVMETLVSQ